MKNTTGDKFYIVTTHNGPPDYCKSRTQAEGILSEYLAQECRSRSEDEGEEELNIFDEILDLSDLDSKIERWNEFWDTEEDMQVGICCVRFVPEHEVYVDFNYKYDFECRGESWGVCVQANNIKEAHEKFAALDTERLRGRKHEDFDCTRRLDLDTGAAISLWGGLKAWDEQE